MRRRKREPKADLTSRKVSRDRELGGEFLEGTESSVGEIESTGSTAFGQAWAESDDGLDESLDSAINIEPENFGNVKSRSLEQKRTDMLIVLGLIVVAVGLLAFFGTRAIMSAVDDELASPEFNTDNNVIVSPLEAREYSSLQSPLTVSNVIELDEFFRDENGDGDLTPVASGLEEGEGQVLAGPVFWAGRAHIAFVSDRTLIPPEGCVVTALASADLEAIDVASAGECDGEFDEIGDRIACMGSNVILLEVWPFNPESVLEPEMVAAIRARLEWPTQGALLSQRATIEFDDGGEATSLLDAASVLQGAPGDVITISMEELSGDCELLDRSEVEVRLLPG